MGFQDFGDFGHPRHPAIRTTGLLTLALAGLTPAEHTSLTGSQLPDGRISRVRLATMTIPTRSSLARRGLSAHSHTPPGPSGLPRSSIAVCRPHFSRIRFSRKNRALVTISPTNIAPLAEGTDHALRLKPRSEIIIRQADGSGDIFTVARLPRRHVVPAQRAESLLRHKCRVNRDSPWLCGCGLRTSLD